MAESNIAENVRRVQENIARAAAAAGRDPEDVTLVAASKTQSAEKIREAFAAGIRVFGENRAQELRDKREAYEGARVHMIGHLQTNKASMVAGRCDLVQSVDSLHLAEALDRAAAKAGCVQDVLCEINIAREADKSGLDPDALDGFLDEFGRFDHLRLRGLMTIGPKPESETANMKYFENCYALFLDKRRKSCNNIVMDILSMGMSRDYEAAIRCGATMVRVGTAIFGPREYPI